MACNVEEEQVWKCPKHPSKIKRNGICPTCLHDRLITLCPDCANVRPCSCTASTSSSSFRRSRSVAIFPFLRSKNNHNEQTPPSNDKARVNNTQSILTKKKDCEINNGENFDRHIRVEEFAKLVTRSRSVNTAPGMASGSCGAHGVNSSPGKVKLWNFSKVFRRRSKTNKVDRPPLHRG